MKTARGRPLARQAHAVGGPAKKSLRPARPPRTGWLVSGHLPGQWPAGLSSRTVQSRCLVSTQSSERSVRATHAHSRSGSCSAARWLSSPLGALASGELASESQAGATTLSTRGFAAPDACAETATHRPASWPRAHTDRSDRALEYGLCTCYPSRTGDRFGS